MKMHLNGYLSFKCGKLFDTISDTRFQRNELVSLHEPKRLLDKKQFKEQCEKGEMGQSQNSAFDE